MTSGMENIICKTLHEMTASGSSSTDGVCNEGRSPAFLQVLSHSHTLTHALSLVTFSYLLSHFFLYKKIEPILSTSASLICANAHCSRHVVCVLVPFLSTLCSDPLCHQPGVHHSTVRYTDSGLQEVKNKRDRKHYVCEKGPGQCPMSNSSSKPLSLISSHHCLPQTLLSVSFSLFLSLSRFFSHSLSLGSPIFVIFFFFFSECIPELGIQYI